MKKSDSILVVLGCSIGILATLLVLFAAGPAAGPAGTLLPAGAGAAEAIPAVAGVTTSVDSLTTKEDVIAFIRSHTEAETGSGPGQFQPVPTTVPAPVIIQGGTRSFSFDVDTSTFMPDEYIVTASAVIQDVTGTALFNLLASRPSPSAGFTPQDSGWMSGRDGFYIAINPISDKVVGDQFSITGTTNLPADAEILVQVYSTSFRPTQKSQSGEFSGATGTIRASSFPVPVPTPAPVMTRPVTPAPAPTMVPTSAGIPVTREFSKTNVQVADVDEADIIKTDGENIYVVTGSCMHILKAYPAEEAKILSTLRFAGYPSALYIQGDRVVLIATDTWTRPITTCSPGACNRYPAPTHRTIVYVFSIADPAHPALVREVNIDGVYTSSRMIGPHLYFVTGTPIPARPEELELPTIHDDHGGITTPPVYGFNTTDQAFAFSTIGSLDVTGSVPVPARTFIIGTAGTVYVSPSHLYIAVPDRVRNRAATTTTVHSFAITNGKISYAAGGKIDGTLLSPYSLDEFDGNLRVATTIATGSWQVNAGQYNRVTVLDRNLATIGSLPDIAPGERIYAARFMGDRLYLVTFRETDPFFVIGLANPERPVILGELKIPGFSSYLHPYDPDHIIGIGRESQAGRLKIALFDVSDVNNPVLKDSETIGETFSTSPVLDDPKAFLFDREKDLLVLPVHMETRAYCPVKGPCTPANQWGGAYVYSVRPDTGFLLKGTVRHYSSSYSSYQYQVKRSLYIENTLYTMSDAKIVMSDLADALVQLNQVDFR